MKPRRPSAVLKEDGYRAEHSERMTQQLCRASHRAAPLPDESPDDVRKNRNARKRERKAKV